MPVMIVLSAPMRFMPGTDLKPIDPLTGSESRCFYIRYHTSRRTAAVADDPRFLYRLKDPTDLPQFPGVQSTNPEPLDQLAATLKPLQPTVFDVWTPMEFRRALAAIVHAISEN